MSKTKFVDFKAVKAAITMEQVLEHYGILDRFKKSGDSLSGPCPIHKGSNPTQFRVSISKNVWNCFSECKHGGNTLDFIAKFENVTIHAAALKAIEWFKLDPEAMAGSADNEESAGSEAENGGSAPAPKPSERKATAQPEKHEPNKPLKFRLDKLEREHPYLAERGLTPETVAHFEIGFCKKGMMAERIAIPIHNPDGALVAYAGRFPGEAPGDMPKYKLPPGFRKASELFNIDRAIKEPADMPLVIVEGFFGCMKLWQAGSKRVVALMGSTMSGEQEEIIRRCTDRESRVILMLDEDEAGRAGREDIAVRLSRFVWVKVHTFAKEDDQPENLSTEEVIEITGGAK
jgi:DNA primase